MVGVARGGEEVRGESRGKRTLVELLPRGGVGGVPCARGPFDLLGCMWRVHSRSPERWLVSAFSESTMPLRGRPPMIGKRGAKRGPRRPRGAPGLCERGPGARDREGRNDPNDHLVSRARVTGERGGRDDRWDSRRRGRRAARGLSQQCTNRAGNDRTMCRTSSDGEFRFTICTDTNYIVRADDAHGLPRSAPAREGHRQATVPTSPPRGPEGGSRVLLDLGASRRDPRFAHRRRDGGRQVRGRRQLSHEVRQRRPVLGGRDANG